MTDENDNTNPAYTLTVNYLLTRMSLPAGSIWIERVSVRHRVVHADFSAFSSSASNDVYVALKNLVKDLHGVWIVILDHADWRKSHDG